MSIHSHIYQRVLFVTIASKKTDAKDRYTFPIPKASFSLKTIKPYVFGFDRLRAERIYCSSFE